MPLVPRGFFSALRPTDVTNFDLDGAELRSFRHAYGNGAFDAEGPTTPQFFAPPTSGAAANGLPIFNWAQAAAQITRQSNGWATSIGAATTVTYAFRAHGPADMPDDTDGFSVFTPAQIQATELALQLWSDVANITFTRVGSGTDGPGAFSDNATILFGNYSTGAENAAAFAYYPGSRADSAFAGDVWVNITLANNSSPVFGQYGAQTLAHEIGHAIGLAHPSNYDASDDTPPAYETDASYWQDSRMFSIMSYFGSAVVGGSLNAFAAGPQLHDIAAAQRLYGANTTTRTGDTIYGFNSNTGRLHYTLTADGQSPVFSIWDAGGNDTLDLSGYTSASEIDLRAEAMSSAGPGNGGVGIAIGNISIAFGVVIENAIGGAGADTIIGNSVANTLTGNGGADTFTGGGGADTILGGAGIDTSNYSLASTNAAWTRSVSGAWTIVAGADGTDSVASVERLHFTDRDVVLDIAQRTFSGNGTSDLLWRNSGDGAVAIWEVTGATQNSAAIAGGAPANWSIVGVGDINGDGRDDMLWRNSADGGVAGWLMNGATPPSVAMVGGAPGQWQVAGMGDFNFDGRDDFVWRNTSDGSVAVWLMNGLVGHIDSIISGAPLAWAIAAVADFDGDGRDDILLRHTDGTLARWTTDGTTQTGAAIVSMVPTQWRIDGTGDFDGDGRADILWRNTSDGSAAIWRMNGATQLAAASIGGAPLTWSIENVGDYNGDGHDDILWRNNDGAVSLWTMNGFTVTDTQIVGVVPPIWDLV